MCKKVGWGAGTVKTGRGRVAPLHAHLIDQGFLDFVASHRNGPLFYNASNGEPRVSVATSPTKPRYVQARERLAMWIRGLGVNDKEISPNPPSTHPILGDELRALRRLQREQQPKSPFVFTSERGAPFSTAGFARMIERAGSEARFGFKAHPHMLRHACGYTLANKGHDTRALQAYLGHRNIQHTVRYTELSPTRFRDFWRG
jgi:hypothetical protein